MPVIYQIGSVSFEVSPFFLTGYDRTASADFAEKDIVGAMKPREAVGEGDDKTVFNAGLRPLHFGGLSNLDVLNAMRIAQSPQPVMRGDGTFRGWFVILDVAESHSEVDVDGIGKVLDVTVTIAKVPDPSADAQSSVFISLF